MQNKAVRCQSQLVHLQITYIPRSQVKWKGGKHRPNKVRLFSRDSIRHEVKNAAVGTKTKSICSLWQFLDS